MKILNFIKSLDKSQLLKLILAVVIVLTALIVVLINTGKKKATEKTSSQQVAQEIKPVEFTKEQLEEYYKVYEDPYVKHIRVALNGYLDGSMKGINQKDAVVTSKTNSSGTLSGLDSFSKDYYKSKFIVLMVNTSVAGGKEINIIFQDKPDKIFWTWVYATEKNVYDLRGFAENNAISGERFQNLMILYKNVIEDKAHSL